MSEPLLLPFRVEEPIVWTDDHVFLIGSEHYFESIEDHYTTVLSEFELNKSNRFLRSEDRKNYVVGKYFLRKTLSGFLNQRPENIQFNATVNKKPIVGGIEFNLSHSANLVAVALSSKPVGIDTEFIQKDFSYARILKDCFSKAEQHLIQRETHPLFTFYTLWTRKEALLKASGKGLNSEFSLNQIEVQSDSSTLYDEPYWLYSSIFFGQYMLSIAKTSSSEKTNYWYI